MLSSTSIHANIKALPRSVLLASSVGLMGEAALYCPCKGSHESEKNLQSSTFDPQKHYTAVIDVLLKLEIEEGIRKPWQRASELSIFNRTPVVNMPRYEHGTL